MASLKRDEWMIGEEFTLDPSSLSSKSKSKNLNIKKQNDNNTDGVPKISSREINSIYRNQQSDSSAPEKSTSNKSSAQSIEWTALLVKRAVNMIEAGETTIEKVALDRFGSIESFEDAVRQVERYKKTRFNLNFQKTSEKQQRQYLDTQILPNKLNSTAAPQTPLHLIEDINKLTAKKIKAELLGDFEGVRALEEQISRIRPMNEKRKEDQKLVLLPTESYSRKKAEKDMTIADMVRHEKLASYKEFDREFGNKIAKNKRFRDDLDSLDEQIGHKMQHEKTAFSAPTSDTSRKAIDEYKMKEAITSECWLCPDSERFARDKDWIVAYGNYCYLAVPKQKSLHPLHCLIVPMTHICSFLDCTESEEEIWEEVRNFKKCLLQLAAKRNRSYVFMECVLRSGDARRHTFIDCVPTPKSQYADDVRGHFYKALQETDEEWSQHAKIIDTFTKSGGLRSAVPRKHFPYFYADFRLDQGYAHVIENVEKFGSGADFGRDIMASLLGVSRNDWRSHRTSMQEKKDFDKLFEPFDWTKSLH